MKKIKALLLSSSALFCFSLASCNNNSGGSSEKDTGTYTLMVYMCGSTLESGSGLMTLDLEEMMSIDIPDNVNIIVRTGGTDFTYDYKYGINPDYIQTFRVKTGKLIEDTSQRVYYSNDMSITMSDKDMLKNFVDYTKNKYPAKKTALILWNHGGGMAGVCQDTHFERTSYPSLLNSDVDYALSSFTGDNKLEWIGYDACLMSVQDIAITNSKHAKYMISSQENEPGGGWAYDKWLPTLCTSPSGSTTTLLNKIADSYVDLYETYTTSYDTTMSVLDLSKADSYLAAWKNLSAAIKNKTDDSTISWSDLANTIDTNPLKFGEETYLVSESKDGTFKAKDFYRFNLYDVNLALTRLSSLGFSNEINAVKTNLQSLVTYNKYGSDYVNKLPCGLSLFCPIEKNTAYYLKNDKGQISSERYSFAASHSWYTTNETSLTTWQNICQSGQWVD